MAYTDAANSDLFDLTVEECCEVGVARSKVRRSGPDFRPFANPAEEPYRPGEPTNIEAFRAEIYDVMTLVELMEERGLLSREEYEQHRVRKLAKLRKWAPSIFEETNGSD